MLDWKEYKLYNLIEIIKSVYQPNEKESLPYIGLEHINQQTLTLNSIGSSVDISSNKYRFYNEDVLFGKLRPYFRKVYKARLNGVCSTDIWVIRAKSGFDQSFIFYFLANQVFIDKATAGSTGTRMPRADWTHLKDSIWQVPDIKEQKTIAQILSSLDDKIELNHQMNETLEKIAQAIFKHWFIDFEFPDSEGKPYKSSGGRMVDSELGEIPEGWDINMLQVIASVTTGQRPNSVIERRTNENSVPVIGASKIMGFTNQPLYNEKLLIMGRVGTHGVIQRINDACFPTDNTLIVRSKYHEYIYQTLKTINYRALNVGSTQPLITQTAIKEYYILIPNYSLLAIFEQLISILFEQVNNNIKESENLVCIRDSLLPKLLSGNIRVQLESK